MPKVSGFTTMVFNSYGLGSLKEMLERRIRRTDAGADLLGSGGRLDRKSSFEHSPKIQSRSVTLVVVLVAVLIAILAAAFYDAVMYYIILLPVRMISYDDLSSHRNPRLKLWSLLKP